MRSDREKPNRLTEASCKNDLEQHSVCKWPEHPKLIAGANQLIVASSDQITVNSIPQKVVEDSKWIDRKIPSIEYKLTKRIATIEELL